MYTDFVKFLSSVDARCQTDNICPMKKIILAILVFSLFGGFAFAQTSQNDDIINSNLEDVNETGLPVRNESNVQVEADAMLDVGLADLEAGTSDTLQRTVNEILKNSSNFSSTDWCRDASSFIGGLPVNAKQSLAWNKNSFNKVVEYVPEDPEQASSYKNAQSAYSEMNVAFDDMLAGLLADQAAGRFVAVARSASIEALVEFKSENPDQDRINGLAEIAKKSVECASPENSDIAVEKISALFGTSFASANNSETPNPTYVNTKITREGITEGTVLVDIETVSSVETMKNYVLGLMSLNEKIVSVEDREDSVVVRYEIPSKFLGFIKGKTIAKVVVNNDLSVKVSYPFFSFLSSKSIKINGDEMEANLMSGLSTDVESDTAVTLKGDYKTKAKAVTMVAGSASQVDTEAEVEVESEGAIMDTVLEGAEVDPDVDVSVQ